MVAHAAPRYYDSVLETINQDSRECSMQASKVYDLLTLES